MTMTSSFICMAACPLRGPRLPSPGRGRAGMKSRDRLSIASLLVVPLGLALPGCEPASDAVGAAAPPAVTVSQPVEREVTDYREYTGRTAAVGTVEVRARVSGYLVAVDFQEGAVVEKGDLLFRIDPRPFQAELDEAKGQAS